MNVCKVASRIRLLKTMIFGLFVCVQNRIFITFVSA